MALNFYFLLLAVGEVLKYEKYVTPQKVQDCIQHDDNFGFRPPLQDCRMALSLMENSGFITKVADDKYEKNIAVSNIV